MARKTLPGLGELHLHPGGRDPHFELPQRSDAKGAKPEPARLTGPGPYLRRMAIFLAFVAAGLATLAVVESERLISAFQNNPILNGAIVAVFVIGVIYVVREVMLLSADVRWVDSLGDDASDRRPPRLLSPMAATINGQGGRFKLSTAAVRSILDGVTARQMETREIARYTIGLLIFLGLLGTFWGLLATVNAVADVIGQLNPRTGDLSLLFGDLTAGLKAPLDGMGTAFSTSLFGLATSLLLGFVDLQAGQAHNRFYNDLEEWLNARASDVDILQSLDMANGEAHNVPAYVSALLHKSAESLDDLRGTIADHYNAQQRSHQAVTMLSEQLTTLVDQMRVEQDVLMRLAENQVAVTPVLERLAVMIDAGHDDVTRAHIRNTDANVGRLIEEMTVSRERLIGELRDEIRLVARTIAAVAESDGGPRDAVTVRQVR